MPNMYLYGDSGNKRLSCAVLTELTAEQQGNRIKITITDAHAAYSDKDRLLHYRLNATDDGIETTGRNT